MKTLNNKCKTCLGCNALEELNEYPKTCNGYRSAKGNKEVYEQSKIK